MRKKYKAVVNTLTDEPRVEFIRSVVEELNYALNSQSMNTELAVQIITHFERHDEDCYSGDNEIELTYRKGD